MKRVRRPFHVWPLADGVSMFQHSASHFGQGIVNAKGDVLLDAPGKSAAHAEHRSFACADAGLVNDRSGEEFERHLAQRHDHLLEIDPILRKEGKPAARQVSKMDQAKVGLTGKAAVAKGRRS